MEGKHCYKASECPRSGDTLPIAEYSPQRRELLDHRRLRVPRPDQAALVGQYVFADYCSGRIWTLPERSGPRQTQRADTASTSRRSARARTASCTP